MNYQPLTATGPLFTLNDFMRVSKQVQEEMKEKSFARYTYYQDWQAKLSKTSPNDSPATDAKSTPTLINTPRTPQVNNNTEDTLPVDIGKPVSPPPEHLLHSPRPNRNFSGDSPTSPTSPTLEAPNPDDPSQVREVVRFVLDASRAHEEEVQRKPYYEIETVEVREERDLWVPREPVGPSDLDYAGGEASANGEAGTSPASPPPLVANGGRMGAPHWPRDGAGGGRGRDERRDRRRTPPLGAAGARRGDGYGRRDGTPPRYRNERERGGYGRRDERRW